MINIKPLVFDSKEQLEFIIIRQKVLRTPLGLSFTTDELASEKDQHHFGIFFNDKLIGGLILVSQENNRIKMRQVCIDFEFQSKGFGQELVAFSEQWSIQNGFTKMYCHARENALNFYKNIGYSVEGEPFIEVSLKHFKLIKSL